MKFSYTLQSIKRYIEFDLDKKDYSAEEVSKILAHICCAIDMSIFEYLGKDTDWLKELAKIESKE